MPENSLSNNYSTDPKSDFGFHIWIGLSPLVLSLIITLVIIFGLNSLPTKLPLFYSTPWGEGQLATHQQMFIIPISIAFIALLNLFISWQLHQLQFFFKQVLIFSSVVASLILTTAFIKIILLFI